MSVDSSKKKVVKTTHEALAASIVLGQCFALIPVGGISEKDAKRLSFKKKSFGFVYSCVYLFLAGLNISFFVYKLASKPLTFGFVVTLLFFFVSFITNLLFVKLAKSWPHIMANWTKIDHSMEDFYGFPRHLNRNLLLLTIIIITAAAIEHAFFIGFAITNVTINHTDYADRMDVYLHEQFEYVFNVIPYSFYIGIFLQVLNLFNTFNWNYLDLFIMLVSHALAARFAQVKHRIETAIDIKVEDLQFWMRTRLDYNQLYMLCKSLNGVLSDIILLSFANNLFVILVQLLYTLKPQSGGGIVERFYFVYSFGFLIIRTILVLLFAAQINVESKETADILSLLPPQMYNIEIERLVMQIKIDPSCFSARGFFSVRKSLVLSIAGAIVTYELIFTQFNLR